MTSTNIIHFYYDTRKTLPQFPTHCPLMPRHLMTVIFHRSVLSPDPAVAVGLLHSLSAFPLLMLKFVRQSSDIWQNKETHTGYKERIKCMCLQLFDFPYKYFFKVLVPERWPQVTCGHLWTSYFKSQIINSSPNKLTPCEKCAVCSVSAGM